MIYFVQGVLAEIQETAVILECNGIGYQIFVPTSLLPSLREKNETHKLYTYYTVREEQALLYGFQTKHERDFFILLISVSGVGPKMGLRILSALPYTQLLDVLSQSDSQALLRVPGVGKKMAERITLELRDKVTPFIGGSSDDNALSVTQQNYLSYSFENDLLLALKTLGYNSGEARQALVKSKRLLDPEMNLEEGLKIVLKNAS